MFEIGDSLREARLRQSLGFTEAEQATKIRAKYLRALEDEQFDVLPAQTYIKGFLRTYAEYLGLDGQLYVDEYNSRFVAGDDESLTRPRRAPVRTRQHARSESRMVALALLAIAAVTGLVMIAWRVPDRSGGDAETAPLATTAPREAAPQPKGIVFTAVRGNSLLNIREGSATGKLVWQGTLERGDDPLWFKTRPLWVEIGTPEVLRLVVNGRALALTGGRPRTLVVTAQGLRAPSS